MNSIWYGLAMAAILSVVHWFVRNDTAGDNTNGIFAMKSAGAGGNRIPRRRKKFSLKPEP